MTKYISLTQTIHKLELKVSRYRTGWIYFIGDLKLSLTFFNEMIMTNRFCYKSRHVVHNVHNKILIFVIDLSSLIASSSDESSSSNREKRVLSKIISLFQLLDRRLPRRYLSRSNLQIIQLFHQRQLKRFTRLNWIALGKLYQISNPLSLTNRKPHWYDISPWLIVGSVRRLESYYLHRSFN